MTPIQTVGTQNYVLIKLLDRLYLHMNKCHKNMCHHKYKGPELCRMSDYTVSKKVPTVQLSVTLSSINRFSKFLHCSKA